MDGEALCVVVLDRLARNDDVADCDAGIERTGSTDADHADEIESCVIEQVLSLYAELRLAVAPASDDDLECVVPDRFDAADRCRLRSESAQGKRVDERFYLRAQRCDDKNRIHKCLRSPRQSVHARINHSSSRSTYRRMISPTSSAPVNL